MIDHRLTDREWAEEWKHLNNLLNCIMDMVEKTRRSLTVLRRCQEADREELNHWIRRYSDAEDMKKGSPPSARPHNSSSASEAPQLGTDPRGRGVRLGGAAPLSGVPVLFPRGSGAAGGWVRRGWRLLTALPPPSFADAHREFAPRPLSGYMPEEIWRKAGECGAGTGTHRCAELAGSLPHPRIASGCRRGWGLRHGAHAPTVLLQRWGGGCAAPGLGCRHAPCHARPPSFQKKL